jgi:hypothetical protein
MSPSFPAADALFYVERNPARAELVKSPADYRWSSAAGRLGLSALPSFLHLYQWAHCFACEPLAVPRFINRMPGYSFSVRICIPAFPGVSDKRLYDP